MEYIDNIFILWCWSFKLLRRAVAASRQDLGSAARTDAMARPERMTAVGARALPNLSLPACDDYFGSPVCRFRRQHFLPFKCESITFLVGRAVR